MFTLYDYIRYVLKPGRFGIHGRTSVMTRAFRGYIPEHILKKLQPGDLFFVQSLGSWLSWLIMYLTRSEIGHVAVYEGDLKISHSTLSGVRSDSIDAIISQDTLIVPCGLRLSAEQQGKIGEFTFKHQGLPYDWNIVVRKGLRIILGREPHYFRLTFFADLIVLLVILDIPMMLITGRVVFMWLLLAYTVIVTANTLISIARPLKIDRRTAKPVELFLLAWQMEADFYLAPILTNEK